MRKFYVHFLLLLLLFCGGHRWWFSYPIPVILDSFALLLSSYRHITVNLTCVVGSFMCVCVCVCVCASGVIIQASPIGFVITRFNRATGIIRFVFSLPFTDTLYSIECGLIRWAHPDTSTKTFLECMCCEHWHTF